MKLKKYLLILLTNHTGWATTSSNYHLSELAQQYRTKAEQCRAQKDSAKALQHYKNAVALNPNDFMLTFETANELYNQGFCEEAITYYDKTLNIRADIEQVYFNKGIALTQLKQHAKAAACYMQAIHINADYEKAYLHAGDAWEKANNHNEALSMYLLATEKFPNNAHFNYRTGNVYKHIDKFEEAVAQLRLATQKNPNNNIYKLELANTLHLIDAPEEALKLYEKILEQHPDNHHVLYNFGYTLKKMGYIKLALEAYDRVLDQEPNYALAHFSRALSYLTLGDWHRGWKEYEWRWQAYDETPKKYDSPLWNGSDINGKRLLIYAEQGLGDTIQFIRYAELIKKMGAYVVVQTQGPLKDLLKLCPYIDEIYARGEALPQCDAHIAMMSLPLMFNTEVETTPHSIPYIFAKPELVDYWANKLATDPSLKPNSPKDIKIGICWQGNPNYRTQFLRQAVASKSMHVKQFSPLARMKGITLYNLQKMGGEDQLKELDADIHIRCFDEDFDTTHGRFMDTVAVMKNLDLIITIDTGTCHVAAALGIPTWNLLPNPADWRWMLERNDTPWYNNMRLFKQTKPGNWADSINECISALNEILSGKKTIAQATAEKGIFAHSPDIEDLVNCSPQEIHKGTQFTNIFGRNPQEFTFESLDTNKQSAESYAITSTPTQKPKETMQELTTALIDINKKLWEYDKKLKETSPSAFDVSFMQLAEKVVVLTKQKQSIKDRIIQAKSS